jgi:alkylhydroperoxidase family enzyme
MTEWRRLDPAEVVELAPAPIAAFGRVVSSLSTAADPRVLGLVQARVAGLLGLPADLLAAVGPAGDVRRDCVADWPSGEQFSAADRTCLAVAEQFVMDVAGVDDTARAALSRALGSASLGFVQALYVLDQGYRLAASLQALFGGNPLAELRPRPGPALWPELEQMMASVASLHDIDPLTAELVRLRGARLHQCRVCSSRRRVPAVVAGGELLEAARPEDHPGATPAQRAAVALTDAILLHPADFSLQLLGEVRQSFTPSEAIELVVLVAHNAANKIAVALAADAPTVASGVEYFDVTSDGKYRYQLPQPR